MDLIERVFQREGSLYSACNERHAFFTSDAVKYYNLWSCEKVYEALTFLLDNIYIRFGSKLYQQIVGIPMGTNCAPLEAVLFLFCYERDFMLSLSDDNQSEVLEAFNSTSRCMNDLLNIDNTFFDSMVNHIYPSELQLNKANVSDTEASFLDLHLSISDLFYSILSHNLGRSSGTTDEFATIPFHLVLFSAALVELAKSIPVHSLILSSHLFFCLPLFLFPFTVL